MIGYQIWNLSAKWYSLLDSSDSIGTCLPGLRPKNPEKPEERVPPGRGPRGPLAGEVSRAGAQ